MENLKNVIVLFLAVGIGVGIGYFVFGKNKNMTANKMGEHYHSAEMGEPSAAEETIYTCSMHPQIRQNEMGICPICEMDLIPIETNASSDPLVFQMTEEAVKISNIQTTIIGSSKSGGKNILLNGKIKPDERRSASIVSHLPGRIEKLFVTFTGEKITKGQKIATIYSPELVSAQRELLEALKLKDISPKLADAARQKLAYWKIPKSSIEQIEQSGKVQSLMNIYADEGGIVMDKKVSVGDYIQEGSMLFETIGLEKLWVIFDGYEENMANIRVGNIIKFTTPAVPGKTFSAKVTYIDPILNAATRAVAIRTEVGNRGGFLKPEMFVKGMLQTSNSSKSKITVPKTAVLWTGPRSVIYLKDQDTEIPSFRYQEITLGENLGEFYEVKNGLNLGDEVVTNGAFVIDAAAQLNNQKSMMNQNVNIKPRNSRILTVPDFIADTPDNFKTQLSSLSDQYLLLKNTLVETNASAAKEAATNFLKELENVDMTLIKGDAHKYWMQQLSAFQSHGKKITTLEEVETQRQQFEFLSDAMINSITAFGTKNKLFVQFCPMAFENKGADWISDIQEVRNPYFGDKMMKCGLVTDTLSIK
ncbi:MAG: efflux RND transporter periplasmic adaptor subunit [Saprospiraceae bacterium]